MLMSSAMTGCSDDQQTSSAFGWPNIPLSEQRSTGAGIEVSVIPKALNPDLGAFLVHADPAAVISHAELRVNGDEWTRRDVSTGGGDTLMTFYSSGQSEGTVVLAFRADGVPFEFTWRG
jgi:hypothetical protein